MAKKTDDKLAKIEAQLHLLEKVLAGLIAEIDELKKGK